MGGHEIFRIRGAGHDCSDQLYADVVGVRRQRSHIRLVAGEHGSARFCERHEQGIDGGALARFTTQPRCPSGNTFCNGAVDHAGVEKPVGAGIAGGMTLEALHEHDGGNYRGPQVR